MCFVELESADEAQKAVEELQGVEMHRCKMEAAPLKPDFRWGPIDKPGEYPTRYFMDEGNAAEEALRALFEDRRMVLSVETPGWSPGRPIRESRDRAIQIIGETLGPYGIDRISDLSVFYGDKKSRPRLLCSIDFKTKEGAEKAAAEKHNEVINGRLIWLQACKPSPWRIHQFWKSAPKLVEEMQEKGVLSKEMSEDKFVDPLPRKNRKTRQQR